jgi:hypothetical protein
VHSDDPIAIEVKLINIFLDDVSTISDGSCPVGERSRIGYVAVVSISVTLYKSPESAISNK